MANSQTWRARRTAFMHRLAARRAARARPATAFVSQPEPRTIGHFARGRQLIAGNMLFAGTLTEAPGGSVWDAQGPPDLVDEETHGCAWLDDLAAVGDARARTLAQAWVQEWITRYTTLNGLRAAFGENRNKLWGDLDPTTTRKLYKSLLPTSP